MGGGRNIEKELTNLEDNLENLKARCEILRAFSSCLTKTLGRSQIIEVGSLEPIKMPDKAKLLLGALNSDKYGFSPDGKEFWVHSKHKKRCCTFICYG